MPKGGVGEGEPITHHAYFFKLSRITAVKWNIYYINEYPIIIWSEEIRGGGMRKKGKKLVWLSIFNVSVAEPSGKFQRKITRHALRK